MKVKELIKLLQHKCDPEAEVVIPVLNTTKKFVPAAGVQVDGMLLDDHIYSDILYPSAAAKRVVVILP